MKAVGNDQLRATLVLKVYKKVDRREGVHQRGPFTELMTNP